MSPEVCPVPRTVVVSEDSSVLSHASTRVLHRYPNGVALVETDAPVPEAGDSGETQVPTGLRFDGVTDAGITRARRRLLPKGDADEPTRPPTSETGRSVSAYVEFVAQ